MNIEILLFDGFDELDAIAPYEVFQLASQECQIGVQLVTLESVKQVKARNGLSVVPDGTIAEDQDLLLIPGGGWNDPSVAGVRREYESGDIPRVISNRFHAGTTIASVCTGSFLLAKAGIIDTRPVTTHHTGHKDLQQMGFDVRDDRFIDDGQILTASGITSGFDLALHIVERYCNSDLSDSIAQELEYDTLK